MNEIILLGMRSQLDTRNKILLESLTILTDIVFPPIARIINEYVFGDSQYINPDTADEFLNGHYESSQDGISMSIGTDEPDCCHSCCKSVLALNISVTVNDWDDSGTQLDLHCMWDYVVLTCDDEMCGYIADRINDGKTDRQENISYAECKKIARALLDDTRRQIIHTGHKA